MTRFPVYASMPFKPRILAACMHCVGTGPILSVGKPYCRDVPLRSVNEARLIVSYSHASLGRQRAEFTAWRCAFDRGHDTARTPAGNDFASSLSREHHADELRCALPRRIHPPRIDRLRACDIAIPRSFLQRPLDVLLLPGVHRPNARRLPVDHGHAVGDQCVAEVCDV
jgi:hypothetical protein